MFGRWQRAEGTIIDRRVASQGTYYGGKAETFEYIADIRPDDGSPPFRASLYDPTNAVNFKQPQIADVVRVKFKSSARHQPPDMKWHRADVKFDKSDPAQIDEDWTLRSKDKRAVAEANSADAREHWNAVKEAGPKSPDVDQA